MRANLREPTDVEVDEFRRQLLALRDDLATALEGVSDAARPVDLDQPIGRLSRMDAIQQQQMARAGRETLSLRARQVEAALERCADGTYGTCVLCGEPVGVARLTARPETPFCIACQTRRERR